ncbi:MAG: PQQ-binding-like beta-propeller repeat protein [Vicinamibacterales bacterium]
MRRVRSLSIALLIVLAACAVSGQQPKRTREPYIAPLLPAEQAWKITLAERPAADGAMDDAAVYVPVEEVTASTEDGAPPPSPAQLVALDRQTGATRWTSSVSTRLPPLLTHGVVVVATPGGIEALDPRTGRQQWSVALDRPARTRMIAQGPLLLTVLEGGDVVAVHLQRREVAWRLSLGASDRVSMTADAEAAYLVANGSRAMSVNLADGLLRWERTLDGELSEPVVDRDRVFIGSTTKSFWSLDARTGKDKWKWTGQIFGGTIAGAAVYGNNVYVVSWDNIVRALDRGHGAQKWKEPVTRPLFPPRILNGIVAVVGVSPTLSTFRADNGSPVSTWSFPSELLLQGAPLIDAPAPYRVAIVAVFRDGQVFGLRPTEMLFKEAAPVPLTALPGRQLPRETP